MSERRDLPYFWADVHRALQKELPRLLDRLRLKDDLHVRGGGDPRRIYPINPRRKDNRPGSFVIWLAPIEGAGAWKDYAIGRQGDVLDLIGYIEALHEKIDVYWWALDFLNWDRHGATGQARTKSELEQERQRRRDEQAAAEAKRGAADAARSADLARLWFTLPPIAGTPAETYLRQARGIPMERLKRQPGALRWAANVERIDPETGEVTTWRNCMVAAMTRGAKVVGLHRTYLRPDGSGKADMLKPKLMIGPVRGSAIRLSSGLTSLSPDRAAKAGKLGPLAVGEGIENALAVAVARPDLRVWAAGSLSLMQCLEWPACASAVVLLADNDEKPEAREAFTRVLDHWGRQAKGRSLIVARSPVGKGFDDLAQARASG